MTAFLVVSALLLAGALFHVLRPLVRARARDAVSRDAANIAVYRDQLRELEIDLKAGTLAADQYDKARREIEQRLLEDVGGAAQAVRPGRARLGAVALGLAIPLCAMLVYWVVGLPQAMIPGALQQADATHEVTDEQIAAMIERLAARLKQSPDNPEGWAMLARSYAAIGRFGEASSAFVEALKRTPDDAQLLADYADALGMAQGRNLRGEPEKLIARALKADPDNVKALALAGTVAFEKKDYSGAVRRWERLLQVAPPGSQLAQSVRSSIEEAQALGGKSSPGKASRPEAAGPGSIRGVARLSPALAARIAPTDTVFIYARAAEGPRMPLAILRKQARDLPVSFVLDDSMAMNPQMKLSSVPRVVITARVTKTAEATARPGDLEGESAPVRVGADRVEVVINSEVR